jgi:quercetin dioxygenase-like cupin family protein
LQLNQIDILKIRYPKLPVGFSTHEKPDNMVSIKIAIAKGAVIFEKHVGVKTRDISVNAYSADLEQVAKWLESAKDALKMCGIVGKRHNFGEKEVSSLKSLRRGVFANRDIKKGERIDLSNTFLAIPTIEGQITANNMSKYTEFYAQSDIRCKKPVLILETRPVDNREKVYAIVQKVKSVLIKSRVVIPGEVDLEISHHYGIDKFYKFGCTIINCVNREYCKKLIVILPGQAHPEQFHKIKEETFQVLYGDIALVLDGIEHKQKSGDIVTVERNVKHTFASKSGAVIEEVSSTHHAEDSYYTDSEIAKNKNRKTLITYWLE